MKAEVREIFCSVQGEGPYVGARQAFVRFPECNLRCTYCDTVKGRVEKCRVFLRGRAAALKNPLTPAQVSLVLQPSCSLGRLHSVSLTGGEPLLYADFIRELKLPFPIYLETNMTLPREARKIRNIVKYVAGDLKLKEGLNNCADYEDVYERTVQCFKALRATKNRDCFCKIVLLRNFKPEEIVHRFEAIERYVSCVVLQPVTPCNGAEAPSPEQMLELQKKLLELGRDVRIIPQTHKILGVM